MAKISLRLYNREIESLIDHNQIEEAIAHCKFILQSYPKHLDTYRLLGNAYLENESHTEAADIFQRVLASIPDDFVSLVGMSIIREYESDLNSAIWYMERAFEIQPANNAVKQELSRLLERREGVKPLRIRMTRGALARMYAKGELYQQAIAEIHAILANDPDRADLQVLLAHMCFQLGQKIEATEVCSDLLKKYPYCLEANRILSQILPETTRAEDVKIYLQRIYALDPYAAVQKDNSALTGISDSAITLDRLDYKPGIENATGQDSKWSAKETEEPNAPKTGSEPVPDWITNLQKNHPPEEQETKPEPPVVSELAPATAPEIIPEWMKSAGWTEANNENHNNSPADQASDAASQPVDTVSTAESDDIRSFFSSSLTSENEPSTQAGEDAHLTPVEQIPDWLKSLEPTAEIEPTSDSTPSSLATENTFLSDEELPDWLRDLKQVGSISTPVELQVEPPAQETYEPISTTESSLETISTTQETPEPAATIQETAPLTAEDVPDWLKEFTVDHEVVAETSENEKNESPAMASTESEEAEPAIEIPDWLKELGKQPLEQNKLTQEPANEPVIPNQALILPEEFFHEQTQELEATPSLMTEIPLSSIAQEPEIPSAEISEIPATSPVVEAAVESTPKVETPHVLDSGLPIWLQGLEEIEVAQVNPPAETSYTWVPEIAENVESKNRPEQESIPAVPSVVEEDANKALQTEPVSEPIANEPTQVLESNETRPEAAVIPQAVEEQAQKAIVEPEPVSEPEATPSAETIETVPTFESQQNVNLAGEAQPSEKQTEALVEPVSLTEETAIPAVGEETQPAQLQEAELVSQPPVDQTQAATLPEAQEIPVATSEPKAVAPIETPETKTVFEEATKPDEWKSLLDASRAAISEGEIDGAMNGYSQLVNQKLFLNEIAQDLENVATKYPENISVLLTLGDTYTRLNKLQEALNIYTKAEEKM